MLLSLILDGIRLGFTAGTLPGPLQSYVINTTVSQGWRKSIIIILSPLIMDAPLIVLVVFILGQIPPEIIRVIRIIGGGFLLWVAWGAWQQFRAGVRIEAGQTDNTHVSRSILARGVLMNALGPGPYIFWSTVNGPLLVKGLNESVWHGLAFLVAFYGTFLGLLTLLVFLFDRVRALDPRVTRGVLLLTIILLVWFGVSLLIEGIRG